MTKKKRHPRNAAPVAGTCVACGVVSAPQALFCHACGAPLNGQSAAAPTNSRRIVALIFAAAVLGIVGATLVGAVFIEAKRNAIEAGRRAAPPAVAKMRAPPASASPSSIDLSTMTPRTAADRLFNRVMSATERGDTQEAMRFAPMAVQAYGRVANLDADASYHLGLLYLQLGDLDGVRRQIESLQQQVPQHLLAFALEREIARRTGDQAAAAQVSVRFAAAYDAEIAAARPEYEAHRVSIEQLRSAQVTPAAQSTAPAPALAANDAAALFESRCGACHGRGALGTEQGPPLVHRIYEPSHHGDESFYRAVRNGAQSHHWKFGDMPPVPGVSDAEIGRIVAYVRALQKANGIE